MKFHWEKLGLLFKPELVDVEFIQEFAQAPSVMIEDDSVRVYFSTRPKPNANGQYVSYSAYVDLDKKNLFKIKSVSEKPILELGKKGTFDEFGTYPVSVIKKNDEYWCYYAGWTRCESVPFNVAIGLAISKDGKFFNKIGDGPILSYDPNEPFILSGPKIRYFNGRYYLFYIAGDEWVLDSGKPEPVYSIRVAISTDGLNWQKMNKQIIPKNHVDGEAQASPDVFFKNGYYHMFFCYRKIKNYRNSHGGYRIGYAYSTDLENWTRDDSKVGIDISDIGWDSESISYPHVFEIDSEIYLLYLGNQVGKQGFGLAKAIDFGAIL